VPNQTNARKKILITFNYRYLDEIIFISGIFLIANTIVRGRLFMHFAKIAIFFCILRMQIANLREAIVKMYRALFKVN